MAQRRRGSSESAEQEKLSEEGFSAPLRWEGAEEVPILFANNIFVRFEDGQFLITIGQTHGPYEVVLTPETREKLRTEGVPVHPIARFSVSPTRMTRFLQVLNDFYNRMGPVDQSEPPKVRKGRKQR